MFTTDRNNNIIIIYRPIDRIPSRANAAHEHVHRSPTMCTSCLPRSDNIRAPCTSSGFTAFLRILTRRRYVHPWPCERQHKTRLSPTVHGLNIFFIFLFFFLHVTPGRFLRAESVRSRPKPSDVSNYCFSVHPLWTRRSCRDIRPYTRVRLPKTRVNRPPCYRRRYICRDPGDIFATIASPQAAAAYVYANIIVIIQVYASR